MAAIPAPKRSPFALKQVTNVSTTLTNDIVKILDNEVRKEEHATRASVIRDILTNHFKSLSNE